MQTQCYDRRGRGWFVRQGLLIVGLLLLVQFVDVRLAIAQQALENPRPNSTHSGIETLFGWVCRANSVQLLFNGTRRLNAVYGTPRADTQSACGDTNNGFVALVNWNDLGSGTHTVALCIDEICGAPISVLVSTYGTSFLLGRSSTFSLCTNRTDIANPPFPAATILTWQESVQNFTILFTATCLEVADICQDPSLDNLCDLLAPCC